MNLKAIKYSDMFIEWGIVFLLIFTPVAFSTVEIWSESVMETGVLFLALIWIFRMYIQKKISIVETPINLVIIMFIFLVTCQLIPFPDYFVRIISPNTKKTVDFYTSGVSNLSNFKTFSINPWATRGELLKLLTYAMTYFLVANNFNGKIKKVRLVLCIVIIGFIEASYGIIHYVSGEKMIFQFSKMYHVTGRLISTFPSADHFSAYIKMCIFLSVGYLIYYYDKGNKEKKIGINKRDVNHRRKKNRVDFLELRRKLASPGDSFNKEMLFVIMLIIMITSLIFTKSRGGILSFFVSFAFLSVLIFLRSSLKKHLWLLLIVIIITLILGSWIGLTSVFDRYFDVSLKEELEEGRLSIWQSTYNIFKDYPVLGTGFGSFIYVFPLYASRSNQAWVNHAHNDWLELLSDTGIAGFLIILSGTFYLVFFTLKRMLKLKNSRQIWIFLGGYTSILSIIIHSFVDFNLRTSANAFLAAVILGILSSFEDESYNEVKRGKS